MKIEIITGKINNPIAEFFSGSNTPKTDAACGYASAYDKDLGKLRDEVPADFARKLERELDEAKEAIRKIEEVFIDSDDTYEDWRKMGNIARDYLKGLE